MEPVAPLQLKPKVPSHLDKKMPHAWRCRECRSILAMADEKKEVLRIKYKDLYVFIEGGKVTVLCRGCGALNTVDDKPVNVPVNVPTNGARVS